MRGHAEKASIHPDRLAITIRAEARWLAARCRKAAACAMRRARHGKSPQPPRSSLLNARLTQLANRRPNFREHRFLSPPRKLAPPPRRRDEEPVRGYGNSLLILVKLRFVQLARHPRKRAEHANAEANYKQFAEKAR
jgi:hypothetical protein